MDPRILRTKKALRQSVIRLRRKTPLAEITVSELCRDSGVNRTTFYKYYRIPEDVYREMIDELFQEANASFLVAMSNGMNLEEAFTRFFAYLYGNRKYGMLDIAFVDTITARLQEFTGKLSAEASPFSTYYRTGGITSIMLLWASRGYQETPEELARICTENLLGRL